MLRQEEGLKMSVQAGRRTPVDHSEGDEGSGEQQGDPKREML